MDVDFNIRGLKELNKELKKLPADLRGKALVQANRAASVVIKKEAVRLAPEKSGDLKRSIRVKKKKTITPWEVEHLIGAGMTFKGKKVYYAHMVEFDTKKSDEQPFMRPAFDTKRQEAVKVFSKRLKNRIDFYNKKLRMAKAR